MLSLFFVTADMLKEIFDHIPQFSLSKKNTVLDQNLSLIIKTSKRWHLNVANGLKGCKIQNITKTRRGHGRKDILMDSHPYGYEISIFTLVAPHEEA